MTAQSRVRVEQSETAAQRLKEQAARLTQVVTKFTLDRRDGPSVDRQPQRLGAQHVRRLSR